MKSLFDQTEISGLHLKNRFFRSATRDGYADANGYATPELVEIYARLARGGVAAIITGHAFVTDVEATRQPGQMGIHRSRCIPGLRDLVQAVHQNNAKIFLQVSCIGAQSFSKPVDGRIWGPSAVRDLASGIMPAEIRTDEIRRLQERFADAAVRARAAGFDGVQIHAAHGYLIAKFLTPYYNRRSDAYGGPLENRARMLLETITAIRNRVGRHYPILVKINCDDFLADGMAFAESSRVCAMLAAAGIDALEISGGSLSSPGNLGPIRKLVPNGDSEASYFSRWAMVVAEEVDVPVILVGGNRSPAEMEVLLNGSNISFFAICRPLIRESDLIDKWRHDSAYTPKCTSCNKCLGRDKTVCSDHPTTQDGA
ncbi:MAG: NADH:flavin oxidoreductase [Desulfosarcinaceae bacterium]|nr:NADH:flavin oxidoreductase [Desulfosarcinaceae bacterium]